MTCQKLSSVSSAIKGHAMVWFLPYKLYALDRLSTYRCGSGKEEENRDKREGSSNRQLALHAFCVASTLGLPKRLARGCKVSECGLHMVNPNHNSYPYPYLRLFFGSTLSTSSEECRPNRSENQTTHCS